MSVSIVDIRFEKRACKYFKNIGDILTDSIRYSYEKHRVLFFTLYERSFRHKKAPSVGIEPTTIGLKGQRSTI